MLSADFRQTLDEYAPVQPMAEMPRGLEAMVDDALDGPLGIESLLHVVVPGDRVVVACLDPLPEQERLLSLLASRIARITGSATDDGPLAVTFVLSPTAFNAEMAAQIGAFGFSVPVEVVRHDPEDANQHSLLATSRDNEPLTVNGKLFDADVVLLLRAADGQSSRKSVSGIYPAFGSTAGIRHAHQQSASFRQSDQRKIDQALGILFEVCVLAGPGGQVRDILAGEFLAVRERMEQLVPDVWTWNEPGMGDLVVATVESPSGRAEWEDLRRALMLADRLGNPGDPVVLVSEVARKPPRRVSEALQRSGSAPEDESETTSLASEILQRRPVFLASRLPQSDVELLGFGYIESGSQLKKLLQRASQPRVVRDAHRVCLANTAGREQIEQEP